ncbi:MAG: hypothetical protein JWR80_6366 [Bradyrhizobium sp.]|nr:hypothetical protein [Bradyrhizobium sp.]
MDEGITMGSGHLRLILQTDDIAIQHGLEPTFFHFGRVHLFVDSNLGVHHVGPLKEGGCLLDSASDI